MVEPQKTQATEINFDPHCGVQVCRAQEGHGVRQVLSMYRGGRREGGSSRRTWPIIIADIATTQAIKKYFLLRKASQLAAISC